MTTKVAVIHILVPHFSSIKLSASINTSWSRERERGGEAWHGKCTYVRTVSASNERTQKEIRCEQESIRWPNGLAELFTTWFRANFYQTCSDPVIFLTHWPMGRLIDHWVDSLAESDWVDSVVYKTVLANNTKERLSRNTKQNQPFYNVYNFNAG